MFSVKAIQELFMESGTASENEKVRIVTLSSPDGGRGHVLFEGVLKELNKFENSDINNSRGWIVNSIKRAKASYNSIIEIIVI